MEALDAMIDPSKNPGRTGNVSGYPESDKELENRQLSHRKGLPFQNRTMTVLEVSKILGISASKLYQLVAGRRIAHYRIGGKILFMAEDIAAYLATCRVGVVVPIASAPRAQIKLKHLRLV